MRLIYPFKHRFHIDYETRSKEDIMSVGRHKYFGDRDFKILMMSYAMDDEPVKLYECYDRQLPRWFVKDILPDPTILKTAYEAPFEIGATEHELGIRVDRKQWECAKIMAAMAGYPMSLSETAKAMKLETLKDTRGKALIKLFTQPALPRDRKRNGDNFWNYPEYFPTEWIEFCEYCVQDTIVERAIVHHPAVEDMPDMPLAEREYWLLDQRINERGVRVDIGLVKKVIEMHDTHIEKLVNEGTKLTGLENINSRDQVKAWLNSNGCILANMKKDTIMETLGHPGLSGRVKRVLQIRQETSKSSMTKYDAMVNCCYRLDRVYGMTQHYGANRTGRSAGRVINLLNMIKNKLKKNRLELARQTADKALPKTLKLLFGRLSFIFGELTRTMFIPKDGYKFITSDFASIESRTGSWFADAEWKLQAFREGKDIYLVNASAMYGIPYEELDLPKEKGKHPLREPAKIGELLAIYAGGENGMIAGGALKSGQLKEKDLTSIKKKWRKINPETVQLWKDIEEAAREAIADPGLITKIPNGKLKFMVQHNNLLIKLPSGRSLSYVNVRIEDVIKKNDNYDPPKLAEWVERELEHRLPVWVWDDLRHAKRLNRDYDCKELAKWFENEYDEELPWFVQMKYCQKQRKTNSIVYEGMQDRGNGQRVWGLADTHGGKIFENCFASDTFVLTEFNGWVQIVDVTTEMRVWDGLKWVSHSGLSAKGEQETVRLDGVGITGEHKVLTTDGWKKASNCGGLFRSPSGTSDGYHGSENKFLNRRRMRRLRREKISVETPMRLRKRNHTTRCGVQKRETTFLRMHEKFLDRRKKHEAFKVVSPNVLGLAVNESSMSEPKMQSISQLRWQRNKSVRSLAGKFSEFLGRYARNLRIGSVDRKSQSKRRLREEQLCMGEQALASSKYSFKRKNTNPLGRDDCGRGRSSLRSIRKNYLRENKTGLADERFTVTCGRKEPVFDLLNCGDLHRFTVKSKNGIPFIVHNCNQGTARDILFHAMLNLDDEGIDTVLHVYDETVNEVPMHVTVEEVNRIMEIPVAWAPEIPLKAEGFESLFYLKE